MFRARAEGSAVSGVSWRHEALGATELEAHRIRASMHASARRRRQRLPWQRGDRGTRGTKTLWLSDTVCRPMHRSRLPGSGVVVATPRRSVERSWLRRSAGNRFRRRVRGVPGDVARGGDTVSCETGNGGDATGAGSIVQASSEHVLPWRHGGNVGSASTKAPSEVATPRTSSEAGDRRRRLWWRHREPPPSASAEAVPGRLDEGMVHHRDLSAWVRSLVRLRRPRRLVGWTHRFLTLDARVRSSSARRWQHRRIPPRRGRRLSVGKLRAICGTRNRFLTLNAGRRA